MAKVFENYSELVKHYNKHKYRYDSNIQCLLEHCEKYNKSIMCIKKITKKLHKLQAQKIEDTGVLVKILEVTSVTDARSSNIIKDLLKLRSTDRLLSICEIDGVKANDPKVKESKFLLDQKKYLSHFKYSEAWVYCMDSRKNPRIDPELNDILLNNTGKSLQITFLPISIFIGFILFKPLDITIKLLQDAIGVQIVSLHHEKDMVNYYKQKIEKFNNIANQISIVGIDKYIDSIKDNMYALMDTEEEKECRGILAVLDNISGSLDWLIKNGETDNDKKITEALQSRGYYLISPALSKLQMAYEHGIPFLHKMILVRNGINPDIFTREEITAYFGH